MIARVVLLVFLIALAGPGARAAADPWREPALALLARHAQLRAELLDNPFHRPVHLASSEGSSRLSGEAIAVIEAPFAAAQAALTRPAAWCEIMMLHLNTRSCRVDDRAQPILQVGIGSPKDASADKAWPMAFEWRAEASTPNYLAVSLDTDNGPLGTRDYRLLLEAVPLDATRMVVRFSYSYRAGVLARLAGQAYLDTLGRGKVGFTVVGHDPRGAPEYIGGMRGVVERNTMRYYLALEAWLATQALPRAAQAEAGRRAWFAAIERYPRQLHDMEREEYLAMKRRDAASPPSLSTASVR